MKFKQGNLFLISGPCVIESLDMCLYIADELKSTCEKLGIQFVFKASFDKANRTSVSSFRGPGLEEGLRVLETVKNSIGVPVLTDIHESSQAVPVAEVVDIIQIPAFLCRQTDLLVAAGQTGKPVNIKKGQFVSPHAMKSAMDKVKTTGNHAITLTERGSSFGYGDLIVDMRSIRIMKDLGCPVIFDGTHSVQKPSALGDRSGGECEMVPTLCRSALAAGADGLFLETHPDPVHAKSDGPNSIRLSDLPALLKEFQNLFNFLKT